MTLDKPKKKASSHTQSACDKTSLFNNIGYIF